MVISFSKILLIHDLRTESSRCQHVSLSTVHCCAVLSSPCPPPRPSSPSPGQESPRWCWRRWSVRWSGVVWERSQGKSPQGAPARGRRHWRGSRGRSCCRPRAESVPAGNMLRISEIAEAAAESLQWSLHCKDSGRKSGHCQRWVQMRQSSRQATLLTGLHFQLRRG